MNRTSETDVSQTTGKRTLDRSLSAGRKSDGKADAGWLKTRASGETRRGVTRAKAARVGESGEVDLGLLPSKNVRHQDSIRQEAKT
jgi:hypothetical protein